MIWRSPGLIDAHAHISWTDFDAADRGRRTPEDTVRLIAEQARLMRACGFTAMRDAGGASDPSRIPGLTVVGCAAMIGAAEARDRASLDATLSALSVGTRPALSVGTRPAAAPSSARPSSMGDPSALTLGTRPPAAPWVKLFLTGGMGAPPEHVLDPLMTRETIRAIIARIHASGRRAMAHVWGGSALDWAIDAGVDTVEHGVYLTGAQAERLAAARIPLVPTVNIYRILADRAQAGPGGLDVPAVVSERAARAADAHPRAVALARDAGVTIGVGTDYCTPYLFGRNLEELDALESCGLTRAETWRAATETNARIIGLDGPAPEVAFAADPIRVPHVADLARRGVSAREIGVSGV
ncbi:amidohydrolase family protein [Bifidobacterium sp. MA2]|uniref:Amidohydrolase family protein n=1 Tax=Bifidobacterium santillanense TaxID=2809028 RepID=A0ABS5UQJ2_9BIFI|nr:amidohydrolase family protein [Bifidobacterium santillanense]MBT1173199.1 amidohydrolase family protein [Bifidobacterium santillanense]